MPVPKVICDQTARAPQVVELGTGHVPQQFHIVGGGVELNLYLGSARTIDDGTLEMDENDHGSSGFGRCSASVAFHQHPVD